MQTIGNPIRFREVVIGKACKKAAYAFLIAARLIMATALMLLFGGQDNARATLSSMIQRDNADKIWCEQNLTIVPQAGLKALNRLKRPKRMGETDQVVDQTFRSVGLPVETIRNEDRPITMSLKSEDGGLRAIFKMGRILLTSLIFPDPVPLTWKLRHFDPPMRKWTYEELVNEPPNSMSRERDVAFRLCD